MEGNLPVLDLVNSEEPNGSVEVVSMAKLETFDNKQTSWEGLWWHAEYNGFSSKAIDLSALRKFRGKVRLYIRKNKLYEDGKNGRPNYQFCIKDAQSEVFNSLEVVEDGDGTPRDRDGNRLYTEEEVWQVIHGMQREYGLPYGNDLISDYVY